MENLIKEHIEKFDKEPNIIGMFWDDLEQLAENVHKAIENNTPYNEEKLLSKEELIAFKSGNLLF